SSEQDRYIAPRACLGAILGACAMLGSYGSAGSSSNYPAGEIEKKYYADGPWAVTVEIGADCCDSKGNSYDYYSPTNLGANGFHPPIITWGTTSMALRRQTISSLAGPSFMYSTETTIVRRISLYGKLGVGSAGQRGVPARAACIDSAMVHDDHGASERSPACIYIAISRSSDSEPAMLRFSVSMTTAAGAACPSVALIDALKAPQWATRLRGEAIR